MRATVDAVGTEYDADDSATIESPTFELFVLEDIPEDDVASPLAAALDVESSFAPLQAASAVSSVQSAARLRVVECMPMFLLRRPVV
jgi:hypothetical protein